jgi:hypothetical protein
MAHGDQSNGFDGSLANPAGINTYGKKVLLVVDPLIDQDRGRYCYWKHLLTNFEERSLSDLVRCGAALSIEDCDVLIINWDCANGDSAFGSDYTLQYFQTQGRVRIQELLQRGGIVICECQTIKGVPVQAAYDAIFGAGEVQAFSDVVLEPERRGSEARVVKRFAHHPVLTGLHKIEAKYVDRSEKKFACPPARGECKRIMDTYPDSAWFGWFTSWKRG